MDKYLLLKIFLILVILSGSGWLGYDLYTEKQVIVEETSEEETAEGAEVNETRLSNGVAVSDIDIGDEIAGMTVVSVGPYREEIDLPLEDNVRIEFTGKVQLSGSIWRSEGVLGDGLECFNVDELSATLPPSIAEDNRSPWFCFTNEESVIDTYGSGDATIEIDNYTINWYPSEVVNEAELIRVIELADTSNWQTYRNEEFGFEFQYPDDWYHSERPRGDNQFLICLNPRGVAGDCMGVVTVSSNINLDERYDAIKKLFEKYKVVESETVISGVQAKMFAVSGYEEGREGFSRELFFEYESLVYNISLVYGEEDIFDYITESFKILTN